MQEAVLQLSSATHAEEDESPLAEMKMRNPCHILCAFFADMKMMMLRYCIPAFATRFWWLQVARNRPSSVKPRVFHMLTCLVPGKKSR